MTPDEFSLPTESDTDVIRLTKTLESVRDAVESDQTLTPKQQATATGLVFLTLCPIKQVRRLLTASDPDAESEATCEPDSWDEYAEALVQIERRLTRVLAYVDTAQPDGYCRSNSPRRKLTTALENALALRAALPEVSSESPIANDRQRARTDGDYTHVEGRGDADGRWLEYQLNRALGRWGYKADTRQQLFGLEVDVVAARREKKHEPSDWLVAQCKDWTSDPVTPKVLFRLCTVAFACRAMPILCHTTELTDTTVQLAREFEVRVLTLRDLERGALPAPHVARPTAEFREWRPPYRARDARGNLPMMFRNEPGKRFSYVPGFTPVGREADYEPIESDRDEDTHPAAGH